MDIQQISFSKIERRIHFFDLIEEGILAGVVCEKRNMICFLRGPPASLDLPDMSAKA